MTTPTAHAWHNPTRKRLTTDLHGLAGALARSVWVAGVALALVSFAVSIPRYVAELERALPRYASGLAQLGIGPRGFVAYAIGLDVALMLAFAVLGLIIFARRSRNWVALFVSLTLFLFGSQGIVIAIISGLSRAQIGVAAAPAYLGFCFSVIALYIFPDGQFVPAWTRVLAVALLVWMLSWSFVPSLNPYTISPWLADVAQTAWYATAAVSLIYRYIHLHTPTERQQTKWVLYALGLGIGAWSAYDLSLLIAPLPVQPAAGGVLRVLASATLLALCQLCLTAAFAIAILRHKLWDIDLIINRTLVYLPLTGIVAGLYSAAIAVFQKLFVAFTGARSDAAVVITTLVLAATFTPIKDVLQKAADRGFKEAPDATKGLKTLTNQVRAVVDVLDARHITQALLDEAVRAFGAQTGAVYLGSEDNMVLAAQHGEWQEGDAGLSLRLEAEGCCVGMVHLGKRAGGAGYSATDRELLQAAAQEAARALRLASREQHVPSNLSQPQNLDRS